MKVSFEFTEDDLVDAAERTVERLQSVQAMRRNERVYTGALAAIAGYFLAGEASQAEKLLWAALAALVAALILPPVYERGRTARLRRAFREQFGGPGPFSCEVELTAEGLATVQAGTRTVRKWSVVEDVRDAPDAVEFATRGSGAVVVRNRAFRSAEERAEFLRLARGFVPARSPNRRAGA